MISRNVEPSSLELRAQILAAPNLLSYHLRVLREAGLIEGRRRGRWIDYRLGSNASRTVEAAMPVVLTGRWPPAVGELVDLIEEVSR